MIELVKGSSYYSPTSDAIVISSNAQFTQVENRSECFRRLGRLLREEAKEIVDNEASAARPGVGAAAQYVIPPHKCA